MSSIRHSLKHYATYQSLNIIVGALSIAVLTRLLAPGEYGLVALASTAVTTVHVAIFYALQLTMGRMPNTPGDCTAVAPRLIARPFLAASALAAAGLWGASALGLLVLPPALVALCVVLSVAHCIFCIVQERLYTAQCSALYQRYGNLLTVGKLAAGAATLVLVAREASIYVATWLAVQLVLLAAIYGLHRPAAVTLAEVRTYDRLLVSYGIAMAAGNALATALQWIPVYYAGARLGVAQAGTASIVITICILAVTALPNLFSFEAYPRLLRWYEEGQHERVRFQLRRQLTIMLALSAPVLVAGAWIGADLMRLVVGDNYGIGAATVLLGVAGALLVSLVRLLEPVYRFTLRARRAAFIYLLGALITLASVAPLGQSYGVDGTLGAMAAGYAFIAAVFLFDAWRFLAPSP